MIEQDPSSVASAKSLATKLGASREHLSRVFRTQRGQTLARHMRQQRMLEACRLLKETSLTTKEIAARLGYTQPANFARLFRGILRLSPQEFRRHGVMPIFPG